MITHSNVRGEHLLWLTPVLYMWIASIIAPVQSIVVFNDGQYYIFSYFTAVVVFLSIIALPYLLHKHFRDNNSRSIAISWMHILSSVIIMFTIFLIYTYMPPIDREWRYFPLLRPNFARWRFFNDIAILCFFSFLLIQVSYLVYGLTNLFFLKRAQLKNERLEMEVYDYSLQNRMANNSAL